MKKNYLFLAALCLLFSLTACSPKQSENISLQAAETSEQEQKAASKADETTKQLETEKETETEAETEKKEEKKAVTGWVDEIDKTIITIRGQDDLVYQVDIKGAETRSDLEIGEGDEIQVVFLDGEEEIKQAESYMVISSVLLEGDMDPAIMGVITESGADTITIEAASGKQYTFSTAIAQVVTGDKGLASGEYTEVTYLESLDKGVALRVITEDGSGNIEATYNILRGHLVSCTETALVIDTADGRQFTFAVDEYVDLSELAAGEEIDVIYEGSLTKQNAVAVGVE